MANEFKVRKGLIVEGSGSAVLDIQGTQGQLFSVTDDLTGDIFSVSDISGVPILNVNADGTTTIDGTLTLTNDEVLDSTSDTSIKFLTRDSNGVVKYHTLGSNAFNSDTYNNYSLPLGTSSTRGGFKIGYSENGKNYPVELSSEKMYVNVPWTDTDTVYTHPSFDGDDIDIDTTALTGATVISDLDFNITTNTEGHVTDANGTVSTRDLTLANLGYTGATNANYITNNNQLTNGAGYTTNTGTLTGNGTSGRVPIYNGTTSFTTDSGFTYSSNKLSIDGVLSANGVDIIDHSTARTILIGDTTDSDEIDAIKFIVMADDKIIINDDNVTIKDPALTGLAAQNSEATALMINGSNIVGTRELGSNAFNSTSIPSLSSNVTIGGDLTVSGNQVITAGSNADVKFSVWNGSTYGIGMTSGVTYGDLNDYAMTFCMNNDTDRGFWWGYNGQTKSDGAMSLTTGGKLKVKDTIEAGYITAVDTILGRDSQFQRNVTFVTEPADSTSTKALVWEASDAPLKVRNIPTNNNQLTNGAGYTTNAGTVTNVQAGNGITVDSGTTTPTVTVAPEARTSSTGDLLINVNGVSRSNYWEIASGLYLQAISDSSGGPRLRSGTGTYSTPSISFKSDTNTGFWGGTDQVNVSCGGSHRAQFAETGLKLISSALGVNVSPSGTNGRIDAGNDIVAYSSSDRRWKENIKPIENALSKILKIGGYEFDWKELTEEERKTQHGNEGHDVGVIAQEVEEVLPEVVTTRENGFKGVKYDKMVALLIEGMKEQQSQIEELKSEIKKLKGEI